MKKVLIIDDSQMALELAKQRLAPENVEVLYADSGLAGLEAAVREQPDLILLDLDMPGMMGFDVCRRLKADPDLYAIPVIFLSGSGGPEDKITGLDLGAVDYVTKPFDAFELRARVRAALRTKHLQDLLAKRARIDPLTGLANRGAFDERLSQEWARIQRHGGMLAVVMADVDRFKRVNDNYGHVVGDRALCEIAAAIAGQCRETDTPVRYGGEEFAIILPSESLAGGLLLAERCRQAVEAIELIVGANVVRFTASFGVGDTDQADSADVGIRRADEALYQAKKSGRNRVESLAGSPAVQ